MVINCLDCKSISRRYFQHGQGMTEYIIVLTALIGLAATTPLMEELDNLRTAINQKNNGYAYALSLSDYPDEEDITELLSPIQEKLDAIDENYNMFQSLIDGEVPGVEVGIPEIDLGDIYDELF